MINERRLQENFLDLVRIDSEAGDEAAIATRLKAELQDIGASVTEDDAASRLPSNSGNLIATVQGARRDAAPIMLCAHMDTVVPGRGVKPVVDGKIVHTDGTTILGGDDKSGIAIILEVLRTAKEQGISLSDVEVVFTVMEEKGLLGAKELDAARLRSRFGLVFDATEPCVLYTRAPAANHLEFRIFGQAAHAGVAPELGINAIKVAGEALAQMRLGRIDEETTANIGLISGGAATNIVAPEVVLHGEARSRDLAKLEAQTRHMVQCLEAAAARHGVELEGKIIRARAEAVIEKAYDAMDLPDSAPIVRLVQQAGRTVGRDIPTKPMGGACDANVFNGKGISVANLGTGMRDIHTKQEWLDTADMADTARIVLEMLRLHAQGSRA